MLKLFTVDKPIHPNSLLYSTQPNQIYIDKDSRKENDKNNKNTANTKQKRMNCVDSKYYYNEIKLSKYGLSGYDFSRFNQYLFLGFFEKLELRLWDWKITSPNPFIIIYCLSFGPKSLFMICFFNTLVITLCACPVNCTIYFVH